MGEKLHLDFAPNAPLNHKLVKSSFHESIKYIITTAQFFGTMPLYNTTKGVYSIRFKWLGFRSAYSLINICCYFMGCLLWIMKFVKDGIVLQNSAPMMFYAMTSITAVVFVNVARHWTKILKEWVYVEETFRNYKKIYSKKWFITLFSIYAAISLVEHLLFILNGIYVAKHCTNPEREPGERFFVFSFPNVYTFINYSIWSGIIVKIANLTATFVWLFSNIMLILISVELTSKFDQIVDKIKFSKIADKTFWKVIREDHQKVCRLCLVVEEYISPLILISYTHDIFFLCMQLYNSLRERTEVIETVYFFYSFGFVVMRLLSLTLFGARLNEASRKPISFLHAVPTEEYNIEVSRMIEQIYSHSVGLTGCGLFLVTRNLLLKIAGTIVTFELMIFQFAPVTKHNDRIIDGCVLKE